MRYLVTHTTAKFPIGDATHPAEPRPTLFGTPYSPFSAVTPLFVLSLTASQVVPFILIHPASCCLKTHHAEPHVYLFIYLFICLFRRYGPPPNGADFPEADEAAWLREILRARRRLGFCHRHRHGNSLPKQVKSHSKINK